MRVRCATFVRVCADGELYLLLLDKSRLRQDEEVLMPINGIMKMSLEEFRDDMHALGLVITDFQKPPIDDSVELHFTVPDDRIKSVKKLFHTWDDDRPELIADLIEETAALSEELSLIGSLKATGVYEIIDVDDSGELVSYLLKVYDLQHTPKLRAGMFFLPKPQSFWTRVRRHMQRSPQFPLAFVSREEIRAGQTQDGVAIASIAKVLLSSRNNF